MEELRVPIKGMGCGSCAAKIEGAVKVMPGVNSVKVDLKAAEARVTIDPSITDSEKIRQKIIQTGYQAGECYSTSCEPAPKRGLFPRLKGK